MRDLRDISGPVWRVILRVISEVILGHSEVILGPFLDPYLRNLMKLSKKAFIWPWVGP